ncbi:MAG: NADH-quinone oxidoreductase subunit E [Deltaproteobacteria bacterium]|nr:NADH-quinone oxidoreductase subunit E [Deltaproteobacteria bacterium]
MLQREFDLAFTQFLEGISPRGRTMLLPALLEAQREFGHISQEIATKIGIALKVPLADVTGVIEFYSMLYTESTGETIIRVCTSPSCSAGGGHSVYENLLQQLDISEGGATQDGKYFVEKVECLGLCDAAPAALVNETAVGEATTGRIFDPRDDLALKIYGEERVITRRVGEITPTSLDDYLNTQGFAGLKKALKLGSGKMIEFMAGSGLLGRGGAAFSTELKWEGAAAAAGQQKYIVCNADESEPGTFKDRILLENDPFAILEGLLIGGVVIGAAQGFIYVRGEYARAQKIFGAAIAAARARGYLGENILGSGFSFDIELRSGAGAYICGEETALFDSIEGKRGLPRLKPPYPTTHGLFQKPTVINNVETFANVALLFHIGLIAYQSYGSEKSSGPWLFSLSGDIEKPGLYEITSPTTLRELLQSAGGVRDGSLQTVLLGGAAGKFIYPDQLDLRLTQEDVRAAGLTLGSGAVIVLSEQTDLKQILADLGHFFAHESCGKCYPCQLGSQRQAEILDRVSAGEVLDGDFSRLQDVGWTMTDASLCGLGQTAASAVLSAMHHWPEIFKAERGENDQ